MSKLIAKGNLSPPVKIICGVVIWMELGFFGNFNMEVTIFQSVDS